MIKLDIQYVIFFYVGFSLLGLIALWVFFSRGPKFRVKEREDLYIWKCTICSHDYIDSKNEDISACPLCGSYNTKSASAKEGAA